MMIFYIESKYCYNITFNIFDITGLPFFNNQFSSRIAFLQTMIFGLLVYNYYSAAIVSSRLNAPLDKMNDSLYSLINSRMKLAAYKDIYFNILLHVSSNLACN